MVGWGTNQFTALLPMYRAALGVSDVVVQATFACYVLGLVPGLLLAGPAADRRGRRAIVLPAAGLSALSGLALMAGQFGVGWLFLGRLLTGVAAGGMFSAGTAWLKELSPAGSGARRATIAMTLGFLCGPLVAGGLARWAPWPGTVVYLPQLVLAAVTIRLIARMPSPAGVGHAVVRTPWPRALTVGVLPTAPWVFATAAVGTAYLPGVVGSSVLLSAAAATLCPLAGVAVQPLARRITSAPRLRATGLAATAGGLVLAAVSGEFRSVPGTLLTALVLGAAYGCCLVYGLHEVQRLTPPHELGRRTAIYQAWTYIGYVVPYPLAALQTLARPPVLVGGLAVLAAATLLVPKIGGRWGPEVDAGHRASRGVTDAAASVTLTDGR
jgi:MFS family permease